MGRAIQGKAVMAAPGAAMLLLLLMAGCEAKEPCIIAGKNDTITIGPREPLGPGGKKSVEVECKREP